MIDRFAAWVAFWYRNRRDHHRLHRRAFPRLWALLDLCDMGMQWLLFGNLRGL
jgi:hypothetical protein